MRGSKKGLRLTPLGEQYLKDHPPTDAKETFGKMAKKEIRQKTTVTLEDFEIRYKKILESDPKRKRCTSSGCNNPVDHTMLGEDTSCAYHRLLFDWWVCSVMNPDKFHHYLESQKGRRRAFNNWQRRIGKAECEKIVLRMALEPINWKC